MESTWRDRQPGSNVGPDYGIEIINDPIIPRHRNKYPGRNRVVDRRTAVNLRERQAFGPINHDRYKCENPFVIHAIGLSSGSTSMLDYWEGRPAGKVPVSFDSRCRKCANCLKHKRRLWTARASDELTYAHRTWFATLTVNPEQRFVASMHAAKAAALAGHGNWHGMQPENQFRYLVNHLGEEITRFLKRVRKHQQFRYLLVSEAHKDGFPHFHMLIHEGALPLTKRLLESNWRLGYSQFRLVDSANTRSAFYVCKYLTKSALTRVRASKGYGREQKKFAVTEALAGLRQSADAVKHWVQRGLSPGPPEKSDSSDPGW